ncbi:MAG: caspase family protein, partial [Verrucomicrobiota bacterium]
MIVGVLEWPSDSYAPFSKANRRDQGLYNELRRRGIPSENMMMLLGREATENGISDAIQQIGRRATTGSTLIFYYAGHGGPGPRGIYFANYDAGTTGASPHGFLIHRLTDSLKKNFKGERVILLADCCHSGGLADVAHDLTRHGFKAASLTSASVANRSTGRWTFTCSIIDALSGRSLLDTDNDGFITLAEAAEEIRNAMSYREKQNSGASLRGIGGDFRLAPTAPVTVDSEPIPKPFKLRQYVRSSKSGKEIARIVAYRDGELALEIQKYHNR